MIAMKQATTYFFDVILQAKTKRYVEKIGTLFPMLEFIGTESHPKQNRTAFEENSVPWTHCFRQSHSTIYKKISKLEKFEEP